MQPADALAQLQIMVQADEDPVLTVPELALYLARARRPDRSGNLPTNTSDAAAWIAATAVTVGEVVAAGDGRYWRCRIAGTTAATEPSWPNLATTIVTGWAFTDGTVVWEDAGGEWAPTWDLNWAAAELWRIKAGKARCRSDIEDQGLRIARSKIAAGCMEQSRSFMARRGSSTSTALGRFETG